MSDGAFFLRYPLKCLSNQSNVSTDDLSGFVNLRCGYGLANRPAVPANAFAAPDIHNDATHKQSPTSSKSETIIDQTNKDEVKTADNCALRKNSEHLLSGSCQATLRYSSPKVNSQACKLPQSSITSETEIPAETSLKLYEDIRSDAITPRNAVVSLGKLASKKFVSPETFCLRINVCVALSTQYQPYHLLGRPQEDRPFGHSCPRRDLFSRKRLLRHRPPEFLRKSAHLTEVNRSE